MDHLSEMVVFITSGFILELDFMGLYGPCPTKTGAIGQNFRADEKIMNFHTL